MMRQQRCVPARTPSWPAHGPTDGDLQNDTTSAVVTSIGGQIRPVHCEASEEACTVSLYEKGRHFHYVSTPFEHTALREPTFHRASIRENQKFFCALLARCAWKADWVLRTQLEISIGYTDIPKTRLFGSTYIVHAVAKTKTHYRDVGLRCTCR